jgi:hypothetical protein
MISTSNTANHAKFIAAFILVAVFVFSFAQSACAADDYEIYNYEMRYHFNVPLEYKDNVASVGTSNVSIYFTDSVYMFVRCSDYYASLTQEERSGLSRNDFTIGRSAMKTLFNSEDYMRDYYEEILDTISHNSKIVSLEKQRMNGTTFWVCAYQTYTTKTNAVTGIVTTEFTGEGRIYINITKGILYQVTVYSLGAYLEETPDAVSTAETFTVGRLTKFGSVFIWILIIAALGAVAVTILMQLNIISYEEEEEVETLGLPDETIGAYNKIDEDEMIAKKVDLALGRISQEEYDEAFEATKLASPAQAMAREYTPEELRHKEQVLALRMVDAVLRVFDEDRAEKTTILNKVETLLDDIKKSAVEPSSNTKKTEEEDADDEAITKVINIDEKAVKETITSPDENESEPQT